MLFSLSLFLHSTTVAAFCFFVQHSFLKHLLQTFTTLSIRSFTVWLQTLPAYLEPDTSYTVSLKSSLHSMFRWSLKPSSLRTFQAEMLVMSSSEHRVTSITDSELPLTKVESEPVFTTNRLLDYI